MHVAYSTSGEPAEPPAALAAAGAAVVVVPRLATPAVEPPPQAAVASARPMTAGATSSNRRTIILRVYTQRILQSIARLLPKQESGGCVPGPTVQVVVIGNLFGRSIVNLPTVFAIYGPATRFA